MASINGYFFERNGKRLYRIDGVEKLEPFFLSMAGDGDLWAFISTNGSLAAGRKDSEGSFFPYETVDKIHTRWESVGPRSWFRLTLKDGTTRFWQPFYVSQQEKAPRSLMKDELGSLVVFEERDPVTDSVFSYEWSFTKLGLVRRVHLELGRQVMRAEVLDGLVGLVPPGVSNRLQNDLSSLTHAYKWNELHEGGRLGLFTLYAQIWDRAEPKESLRALAVWTAGDKADKVLLSRRQVSAFLNAGVLETESLTRGQPGCFLEYRVLGAGQTATWVQVLEGPLTQSQTVSLATELRNGARSLAAVEAAVEENRVGLASLLAMADYEQSGPDPMTVAHHASNVLFNVQRGGVFPDGLTISSRDFVKFVTQWNAPVAQKFQKVLAELPEQFSRSRLEELVLAQKDAQLERLFREYLPLSFSRRHGDPSRPWNRFSIRIRDEEGHRLLAYEGNWRDIFQNWEALAWSWPEFLDGFVTKFLSAMSRDGYNPYRIGRSGVDWEVVEHDNPWSNIGYWGDHQLIYLLKFLELAQASRPGLLESLWNKSIFATADVPYRLAGFEDTYAHPKKTVSFDEAAHDKAMSRVKAIGFDGRLVTDAQGQPLLTTMADKIFIDVLVKTANLIPGCGLWLNTQRPEWNDANNALVGYGVSVVSLAYLRRFLVFLGAFAAKAGDFTASSSTRAFLKAQLPLLSEAAQKVQDSVHRYKVVHDLGLAAETWRKSVYSDQTSTEVLSASEVKEFVTTALAAVDASLGVLKRKDGLWQSYNLVDLQPGRVELSELYPMLEGQVAILSSGFLSLEQAQELVQTLAKSPLYDPSKNTYLLYPDRALPAFWEKNRLDNETASMALVQKAVQDRREDLIQKDPDGTLRFGPDLANREDLEALLTKLASDKTWAPLVEAEGKRLGDRYELVFKHKEFTGRSGTMFGYEGLGCVYWHMVSKLLLAVQENFWNAWDQQKDVAFWKQAYQNIRNGLGYRKTVQDYGAFPFDPYSHTPSMAGAQQPGMTGQVKEEVLTRWGELGLRWKEGRLLIEPALLEGLELRGEIRFQYRRTSFVLTPGSNPSLEFVAKDGTREKVAGTVEGKLSIAGPALKKFEAGEWQEIRVTWVTV